MSSLLVILGPTATGKSDLAVRLAKKYNGEVISADSRQVYTGLDIGTGKVTAREMGGVPHHLLDVVSPKKVFSVAEWREKADAAIADILSRGKLPIICGGTGFYIQSIVDDVALPPVPPNSSLRKRLEKKSASELYTLLSQLDGNRARTIDKENPARLMRAIEIAAALGAVPAMKKNGSIHNILQIGLTLPDNILKQKIKTRLVARMKKGMLAEARRLHAKGLSWKRMHALGLEYRYEAELLQGRISRAAFVQELEMKIWQYARRQMTWFRRDKRIQWFSPKEVRAIDKKVAEFLKKSNV